MVKTTKHTLKNYPFLKEMRKEGWDVNGLNKHILISAYEYGKKSCLSKDTLIEINKRLSIIIGILEKRLKEKQTEETKK